MVSKLLNKKQHKVHQAIKTFYTPPNLKLTLSSMFKQTHVRIKDKSFKLKYKGKGKKAPNMMTNLSSYFLQNG